MRREQTKGARTRREMRVPSFVVWLRTLAYDSPTPRLGRWCHPSYATASCDWKRKVDLANTDNHRASPVQTSEVLASGGAKTVALVLERE